MTPSKFWRLAVVVLRPIVAGGASLTLSGCLWLVLGPTNTVRPGELSFARPGTTQIVFGVATEADWPAKGFSVQLDRYDPVTGEAGNCSRHDNARGSIPPTPTGLHYFVFDVPAGNYVFSALNGQSLDSDSPAAFVAPAGQSVYLGDFVLVGPITPYTLSIDGPIVVRRDLAAAKAALGREATRLELADVLSGVRRGRPFLCTP